MAVEITPVQYPFFAGGCSAERIAAAKLFFGKEENQAPWTEFQLGKVAEQVQNCISLRDREKENVEAYLKNFVLNHK